VKGTVHDGSSEFCAWNRALCLILRPGRGLRQALIEFQGILAMLILTTLTAVASLVYLVYAMLRPERF
jgi:K+-transporting ATPase KdpF subunit